MAKSTFAGTVLSHNQNTNRDKQVTPGGSLLIDFKVKDGEPLQSSTLAQVRLSDQEAYDYMKNNGLDKGATVAVMAAGIHEWEDGRDRVLPAKGSLPERKIRRFMGLDLNTIMVTSGVKSFNTATSQDETAKRGVASIVSSLAASALGLFKTVAKAELPNGETIEELELQEQTV